MPGLPFLPQDPSPMATPAQAVRGGQAMPAVSRTAFFVWLIVIGVVLPGVIPGTLRAGGYQFVFRR